MAKVSIKSEKLTPFGGIYFTNKAFNALSLGKVINETLGTRSLTYNGYQWDEIVTALLDVYLCGGDCVEDVNRKECHLRESPGIRILTSHTVGRAIKELACENIEYKSQTGNVYRFNTNSTLNDLLMKLNMAMGLFQRGQTVNVDFDHVALETNKYDAKYSYKHFNAYFPGVVSVNGIVVYIENRDGNTPVKFHQAETLARSFSMLHSYGLHIGVFRADCGSYSEDIIRTVDGNCRVFYIRASNSASMYSCIRGVKEWKRVEIGAQETEVASFMCTHFMEDSHYRIVVQRTKVEDETPDLFGEKYVYRCIITNDWDSDEKSVIETYNKRGARECDFARLNNDFGWKHLPCSFMNENTVFMILTAMCMNFFSYFIGHIASVFTKLTPTSRVKTFVFHFTAVCAKWTRSARRWWLNLYTDMPYDKLSFG